MTPTDRRRLAAILGMLGSEFDGERAAAGLQAEAFRKKHGLTWEQMLTPPSPSWARPWEQQAPRPAADDPPSPPEPPPAPPPPQAAPRAAAWRSRAFNIPAQAVAILYVGGLIGGAVLINIHF
jgi:hypothetical protein